MGWIITKDVIGDDAESAGEMGPAGISREVADALLDGEGKRFRMLDDDRIVYYYGRWIEDEEAESLAFEACVDDFQPLDNFGAPYAGCTIIQYRNDKGQWEDL